MALGAERRSVLKLIIRQAGFVAGIGIAIGIAGTFVIGKWISTLLFGVRPNDPVTLTVAVLVQSAAVLIACYIPARRAMKVDPVDALRHD
jgi:putative ABC transport system permease protein